MKKATSTQKAHTSSDDKKVPKGGTKLLKKEEWCKLSEIQGTDLNVLYSHTMNKAFKKIVEIWQPKHKIAYCGLCTVTRPYSSGKKWKTLNKYFSSSCDLIINSNGGIIPIEFENEFPYLNYDAHGKKEYDTQYIEVMTDRLKLFFSTHRYEYIMFNFRHNLRNVAACKTAGDWLKQGGYIKDYKILPTKEHYEQAQKEKFHEKGFAMFPELYPTMLLPVIKQVKEWKEAVSQRPPD